MKQHRSLYSLSGVSIATALVAALALVLLPAPPASAQPSHDLAISATALPNPVTRNGQLTLRFTVVNNGPSGTAQANVLTSVPEGTTFVSASTTGGTFDQPLPPSGGTGSIRCQISPFANGQVEMVTIVVTVTASPGSTIAATGSIQPFFPQSDPIQTNNNTTVNAMVASSPTMADLGVTIAPQGAPVAGSAALFTTQIQVSNLSTGPTDDAADNVTLTTFTPATTTFSAITVSQGAAQAPAVGESGPVVVALGTLEPGAQATVVFTVAVIAPPATQLVFSAAVSSDATDPVSSNDSASLVATVQASGTATLTFDPPPARTSDVRPAPRNLVVAEGGASALQTPPAPPQVIGYKVYRSNRPNVQPSPGNLFATLPPTQTSTTVTSAPGGTFYVVTACYPDGESAPSNEGSAAIPAAVLQTVKIASSKITATGTNFTDVVTVSIDEIPFATAAKLKKNNTKVVQKGSLQNGQTIAQYMNANPSGLILFRNSTGAIAAFRYGE